MSPEMAQGHSYTRAADVWALGCIIYEMMSLSAPWLTQLGPRVAKGLNVPGLMRHISRGVLQTEGLRKYYSDGLCALLCALVSRDPAKRPSLASVLEWPIMQACAPGAPLPWVVPPHASPTAQDEPMGAEKHVAAQVLQRSFRRERPSAAALFRPLAPVAPSAEVEPQLVPAAELAPMDIVDATLPLHSEPTAPIDNDEAATAAAKFARRAAKIAARAALQHNAQRVHYDCDSYLPCPRFVGARPGFVFKNGRNGLGYYRDWLSRAGLGGEPEPTPPTRVLHLQNQLPLAQRPVDARIPRPSRPAYVAAPAPLSRNGLVRAPSVGNITRLPSKEALGRAPSAGGLGGRDIVQPPRSAREGYAGAGVRIGHDAQKRGCAAAAAGAQVAAKRALDAAAVARVSAAGAKPPPQTPHGGGVAPVSAWEAEDTDPSRARRDPTAARLALRAAMEAGRPAEVAAAAKAAQKIIDSFKRSQVRRRQAASRPDSAQSKALQPLPQRDHEPPLRVTLNRRHVARRPIGPAPISAIPRMGRPYSARPLVR